MIFLRPLTLCIKVCIENETHPNELKQADITPKFNKGKPKVKSNCVRN